MNMSAIHTLLSQQMIERLGWILIHFIWQAALVAVLLAGMLRLLHRSSANVRYATACAALGLIVALPLITMQFVEVTRPAAEAGPPPAALSATVAPVQEPAPVAERPAPPLVSAPPLVNANVTAPIPLKERLVSAFAPALPYLVLGWLVGVFGLAAWHLGGWTQLQRLRHRMVRPVANAVQTRLTTLAERVGICRTVGLLESMLVEVPTVVGWVKPVILLPAGALTGLSGEQLEAILAHELAHIHRCDYLVNILQTVVEILGFYHPALWWVSHRIRVERENCCDDLAVQVCGDSLRYARALTCLEEVRHHRIELAVAADGGSLTSRIARLLGRPANDDRRFAWLPGLIALLLVGGLVIPLVCSGPVKASREMPGNVTTSEKDPNATGDRRDANESPAPEAVVSPPDVNDANDRVLTKFIVARVRPERKVDRQTAVELSLLLERSADRIAGSPVKQIIEEATDRPVDECTAVVDLLNSRGYLETMATPQVLSRTGERSQIRISVDPNDARPGETVNDLRLTVVPKEVADKDAVQLPVDFELRVTKILPTPSGWTGAAQDRPMSVRETTGRFMLASEHGGYAVLPVADLEPADPNAEILCLMASATVAKPQAAHDNPGNTGEVVGPDLVAIAATIVTIRGNATLDADTAAQAAGVLASPMSSPLPPPGQRTAARPAPTAIQAEDLQGLAMPEVLRKLAARVSEEEFRRLLSVFHERGYLHLEAQPQWCTAAGKSSTVGHGGPSLMRLTLLPTIVPDRKTVQCDVDLQLKDAKTQDGTRTRLEIPDGRCVILRLDSARNNVPSNPGAEMPCLILGVRIVPPPPHTGEASSESPRRVELTIRAIGQGGGYPNIAWNQRLPASDRQEVRIKAVAEKPLTLGTGQETDSEILISVAPRVYGDGRVALDVVTDVNDSTWPSQGTGAPAASHRTIQNTAVIPYGSTVAAASMTYNPSGQGEGATREVAVFVTVDRIR
jgi:beta-lactamase regulating signal transducer with metallopeptidase domain